MTISAKIVCDSISQTGIRLTTMELTYHRFIHSELMTHRMFSRNASSSRAIPVEKMLKQVQENPAMPVYWGRNQPGMQAREEVSHIGVVDQLWKYASKEARYWADQLHKQSVHKQIVNRVLEPFQYIKVILSATEFDNFFQLRNHKDAQPEIQELARCMKEAMDKSIPEELEAGHWHLPYIKEDEYCKLDDYDKLIKCSVARCARVSYLNHDNSTPDIAKDIALADRLLEAGHMSPFEHQATPMKSIYCYPMLSLWEEEGTTHIDKNMHYWSGNFRGWIQHRQLLAATR